MANEERFSGLSKIYRKYRPSYSEEVVQCILDYYHLTKDSVVIDVGCGTGNLSKVFLDKGMTVFGVEPNLDMRKEAQDYLSQYKKFTAVEGNDGDFNVGDQLADLVICAQAFHWFDIKRYREECKRVLKPSGGVAIIYADWNPSAAMTADLRKVNDICVKDKDVAWKVKFAYSDRYLKHFFGEYQSNVFESKQIYNFDRLIGFMDSYSFSPRYDDSIYPEYYKNIKKFFEKYKNDLDETILVPFLINVFWGNLFEKNEFVSAD